MEARSVRREHAVKLFSSLPRRYDLLAELLSFGQNGRWRRFLTSRVPAGRGDIVLDVATGTGHVGLDLGGRTGARVVGLDQSEEMVRGGVERAGSRMRFVLGNGERLPFPDRTFDALTFTYLLRYVDDPAATLRELVRVVRPGGTVANLEFHVPPNPVWRGLWWLYTRAGLPVLGRLASRSWFEVGRFLGPSVSDFYRRHPLSSQLAMWREAGVDVRHRLMSLGGGVVIWGRVR